MNDGSDQQGIVQISLASAMGEYLERIRQLGAVEGVDGAVELSPTLQPVLEAMHHVLAGGEVEVRIIRGGQPGIFQELQQRATHATEQTHALNHGREKAIVAAV